jgi:hypothetical protein
MLPASGDGAASPLLFTAGALVAIAAQEAPPR